MPSMQLPTEWKFEVGFDAGTGRPKVQRLLVFVHQYIQTVQSIKGCTYVGNIILKPTSWSRFVGIW